MRTKMPTGRYLHGAHGAPYFDKTLNLLALNLTRFIAVDTDEDKTRFEAVGMHPVVNRSIPRGIDIAAAVLRSQHVDEAKIQDWMQRQQERALQASIDLDESLAKSV